MAELGRLFCLVPLGLNEISVSVSSLTVATCDLCAGLDFLFDLSWRLSLLLLLLAALLPVLRVVVDDELESPAFKPSEYLLCSLVPLFEELDFEDLKSF